MLLILTTDERKLIRRIAWIELSILHSLVNETCITNIPEFMRNEVPEILTWEDLKRAIRGSIIEWSGVMNNPDTFLYLSKVDLRHLKHIMEKHCMDKIFDQARKDIWYKINLLELNPPINYN